MDKQLILIKNTNGNSISIKTNPETMLSDLRKTLIEKHFMVENDFFLNNDAPILTEFENEICLFEILDQNQCIYIGKNEGSGIQKDIDKEDYRDMSETQKEDLFRKCQIFRGITFSQKDGIKRAFHDLFSWNALPAMNNPRINTQELSSCSFSKITQDINLLTNNKASLALDTPFLSANAEYDYQKSKTSASSKTEEFLLEKYMVSKADFEINPDNIIPNPLFAKAVAEVINSSDSDKDKMCNLLHVLNEWGLYIPCKFTLGGLLYSTETTKISDFSQSEEEKRAFSASVKLELNSVTGNGNGSSSKETTKTETDSKKYTNIVINQIGGTPGQTKNKEGLAISLNLARYWELIDVDTFYPSLLLLNNPDILDAYPQLLSKCLKLLNNNTHHAAVKQIQPYINMFQYATDIENYINPF